LDLGSQDPVRHWALFPHVTAKYARPRQLQLAISAVEFFDRSSELFKNLNIPVAALPQLASQLHHFETFATQYQVWHTACFHNLGSRHLFALFAGNVSLRIVLRLVYTRSSCSRVLEIPRRAKANRTRCLHCQRHAQEECRAREIGFARVAVEIKNVEHSPVQLQAVRLAGMAISFGVGMAMGAAWGGGFKGAFRRNSRVAGIHSARRGSQLELMFDSDLHH